ncbi:uncharacterized protein [Miscanthus floridulus]|uniref:uncharacterized protein n=1 Tax=Miscanthus floridulus TaxID=154761 RepID=UPI0034597A31
MSIGQHLVSGHDVASFRSTCSPWRAAVLFATFRPLLLLPFDPDLDRIDFYYVSEKKVLSKMLPNVHGKVACGSSCGWVALMDEAASSSERMSRVHGRWVLHPSNSYGDVDAVGRAIKLEDMRDMFFREIMHSALPDAVGHECVAIAMLGCSMEVAFCWVGVDSAWTLLDTKLEFSVGSIVHCQDKFLAIDCTGEISVYSSNAAGTTPTSTLLPSLSPPVGLLPPYLPESNGQGNQL